MGRSLFVVVLALAVVLGPGPAGASRELEACSSPGYAYAGIMGANGVAGIKATLIAAVAPGVTSGHVAGWVGVGGPKAGPGGVDEWLQVGLSSLGNRSIRLYYELAAPGVSPHYVDVRRGVVGRPVHVAVLEIAKRPSWWRVWVDDHPVSAPIRLTGSEGRLVPVATAESWRPSRATPSCNTFAYRFEHVRVVGRRGGSWSSFVAAWTFRRSPYRVERRGDGFVAAHLPA